MSDHWDFYRCQVDSAPASIFLDMGVARSAPIPGFESCAYLRIWMNQPRPDGLSSEEEYDRLFAIEEALEVELGHSGTTVYVGRNTSDGTRDLFFYISDEFAFRANALATISQFSEYRWDIRVRSDEKWSVYFDFLYPNDDQKQVMGNRRVIETLVKNGDNCQIPRQIDHLIIVNGREQADALARSVSDHGFKLKRGSPSEEPDTGWVVEFDKAEAPAEIDETTIMLSRLARDHGGDYDGWGCLMAVLPGCATEEAEG